MQPPQELISLSFRAENLHDRDLIGFSDPICFVSFYNDVTRQWTFIGRTEAIKNNLNPNWTTSVMVPFKFEIPQQLRFSVYDVDDFSRLDDVTRHDFLGQVDIDLASIVTSPGSHLKLSLVRPDKAPAQAQPQRLTVFAETPQGSKDIISFSLSASSLPKLGLFARPHAYVEVETARAQGEAWGAVHRTPISVGRTVSFGTARIPISKLCGGDYQRPIRLTVFHQKGRAKPIPIGRTQTCTTAQAVESGALALPLEPLGSVRAPCGMLRMEAVRVDHVPSFLDFIRAGTRLRLSVAIDMTGSNGNPAQPGTLHYMDPSNQQPNEYQSALYQVASVLLNYTRDPSGHHMPITATGFGARLPDRSVSHFFPLTLDKSRWEVGSIEELMVVYQHSLTSIALYGPTIFAPTIAAAAQRAQSGVSGNQLRTFDVALVVTDGAISDLSATIHALCEASAAPMAVVIVGVGAADFSSMDRLDADEARLVSPLEPAVRQGFDNVQFVPFRANAHSPHMLAAQTLAELPEQLETYARLHGLRPAPM
eukprot:gnl/Dysnectes_brevis/665_a733_2007.p1 GENE.gnl/Dysnectes_brevis/665_a733_2007~~gnl/Dysnectes_brevis/665_a733_2007.p1  ORF type:complete len:537 (+),score=166.02 gnl/Dysnectes_brevis/665_a733_2007:34-1644(+)